MADKVGPEGRIVSLEADPYNAMVAQAQMSLNHMGDRCRVLHRAGSDQSGILHMESTAGNNTFTAGSAEKATLKVEDHRKIEARIDALMQRVKRIRDHRNKSLAHADLNVVLGEHVLPSLTYDEIEQAIAACRETHSPEFQRQTRKPIAVGSGGRYRIPS